MQELKGKIYLDMQNLRDNQGLEDMEVDDEMPEVDDEAMEGEEDENEGEQDDDSDRDEEQEMIAQDE